MTDFPWCGSIHCATTNEGAAIVWAAIIGLIGGLAAVVGAIIIGRRQLQLLDYQASLQAEIGFRADKREAEKIRVDLWEKRFAVYQAVAEFIGDIIREGHPPGYGDDRGTDERKKQAMGLYQDFHLAIETSKILFSDGVHADLERIRQAAIQMHYHWGITKDATSPDYQMHVARRTHYMARFAELRDNLTAIFGDDLKLGNMDGHPGRLTDDLHQA